jgi:hypothetical protein
MCPAGKEQALQNWAQGYLRSLGYDPPDEKRVKAGAVPPAGVYYHLPGEAARDNPYMLDLLILDRSGRFLALELKTVAGEVSARQRWLMVAHGNAVVCRSPQDAMDAIREWQQGG